MSDQIIIKQKKTAPFTGIPNKVLQNIHDLELLGLFCYLVSLPDDWIFYKHKLREHGKIGINKLDEMLSKLEKLGLVEQQQIRNEDGTFAGWKLIVSDGFDFKIPKNEELSTEIVDNRNRSMKTVPTVTVAPSQYTTNNKYKNNNNKSFSASPDQKQSIRDGSYPAGIHYPSNNKANNRRKQSITTVDKSPTTHVDRNTMTEECKKARKGKLENEENFMSNLPKSLKPKRYRTENPSNFNSAKQLE